MELIVTEATMNVEIGSTDRSWSLRSTTNGSETTRGFWKIRGLALKSLKSEVGTVPVTDLDQGHHEFDNNHITYRNAGAVSIFLPCGKSILR